MVSQIKKPTSVKKKIKDDENNLTPVNNIKDDNWVVSQINKNKSTKVRKEMGDGIWVVTPVHNNKSTSV